jgi:geranylgeranyl diphosphate synthase type II
MAFEVMLRAADRAKGNHRALLSAAREIADGAGACGMVGGQSMDLFFERAGGAGEGALLFIHKNKTARMFIHPLRAAALLSGADEGALDALTRYGAAFGMLFQATDDLLDVLGDAGEIGKSTGKDEAADKLTCVKLYGIEGTRALVDRLLGEAVLALGPFGEKAAFFAELAREMAGRTR